ncbi:helix-turn-helix domain-containing protein [Sphingomonas sp. AOB5]|uniref:helix-turn-helix domain-containing protein n=1 Tax=Sphingomonas sp. AOB5 TaxID=3034017 RepID=UPI0023F692A6|nr:helix-turn-helix domain-containing protein [Sphingomonas sp. AOB5]MDF7777222.1 helix-turn-helix domain-containing protein [Sphingomonas sp. AOB5]
MNAMLHQFHDMKANPSPSWLPLAFGVTLESTRVMRGATLADAAAALDIEPRYLSALEREAFEEMIYPIHAMRIARDYVAWLDLPERDLMAALPGAMERRSRTLRREAAPVEEAPQPIGFFAKIKAALH